MGIRMICEFSEFQIEWGAGGGGGGRGGVAFFAFLCAGSCNTDCQSVAD